AAIECDDCCPTRNAACPEGGRYSACTCLRRGCAGTRRHPDESYRLEIEHSSIKMLKRQAVRIVLVTNVREPVLRAYVGPLAVLDEVAEVVVIRDRADVEPWPKVRIITPRRWWPLRAGLKLVARRVLLARHASGADLFMTLHWFPDGPMVVRCGMRLGIPVVANIIGGRAELIAGGRRVALAPL